MELRDVLYRIDEILEVTGNNTEYQQGYTDALKVIRVFIQEAQP